MTNITTHVTTYATNAQITEQLPWVLNSPADHGSVSLIVVRPGVEQRAICQQAIVSPDTGVAGDNWQSHCWKKLPTGASDPDVQVAIMNSRMIDVLCATHDDWPLAGDQLFVDFDLSVDNLSAGDQLAIGSTVLEITAEPHRGCRKFKQRFGEDALKFVNSPLGDKHRLRGIYAKVITSGEIKVGDEISKR